MSKKEGVSLHLRKIITILGTHGGILAQSTVKTPNYTDLTDTGFQVFYIIFQLKLI